jgi:hypothetical protein
LQVHQNLKLSSQDFKSHAGAQAEIAQELHDSPDTVQIEAGVRKFVEWTKLGEAGSPGVSF